MKGGFELVVRQCSQIMESSKRRAGVIQVRRMNIDDRNRLNKAHRSFVNSGETVIALAKRVLDRDHFKANHNFNDVKVAVDERTQLPREGFCFVGMIAFIQKQASNNNKFIKLCKKARIKVRGMNTQNRRLI